MSALILQFPQPLDPACMRQVPTSSAWGIQYRRTRAGLVQYLLKLLVCPGVQTNSSQHCRHNVQQRWLCRLKDVHYSNGCSQPRYVASKSHCTRHRTLKASPASCEKLIDTLLPYGPRCGQGEHCLSSATYKVMHQDVMSSQWSSGVWDEKCPVPGKSSHLLKYFDLKLCFAS